MSQEITSKSSFVCRIFEKLSDLKEAGILRNSEGGWFAMSGIGEPQRFDTGLQSIDCVVYRHVPDSLSLAPRHGDITLYRILDYGTAPTTQADRPADEHDLLLLTRGSGQPNRGKLAGTRFCTAGNRDLRVSFVPQGADATIEFGTSAKSINVLFPKGCLGSLIGDRLPGPTVPRVFEDNIFLIGLIGVLEIELFRPGIVADMVLEQAMRSIALILSNIDPYGFNPQSNRITIAPARLKRVLDFIEDHLSRPLTISMLAEVAGLSMFHFSRAFNQATGMSPYRYVRDRRLYLAQRLLMGHDHSLREVALACGFPRPSHFSSLFAQARGLAPSEFRKRFAL